MVTQVIPDKVLVFLRKTQEPAVDGLVIVGTGVNHTVIVVVMGQVIVCAADISLIKSKLQYLHVGIAAVTDQLANTLGQQTQVFGNDTLLAQGVTQGVEQIHAGTLLPVAVLGAVRACGNGEVLIEATEVVNADHIIELVAVPHSGDPPVVARGFVVIPTVEGVAPNLAVGAEAIGRTACDLGGHVHLVQLEHLGLCPDIGAVGRHINGHIAYDLDVLIVGVFLQLAPLLVELKLQVFLELHLEVQLFPVVVQGKAIVHADIIGPLSPAGAAEEFLHRHKQGIVIQPPEVFPAELLILHILIDLAALISSVEQIQTVIKQRLVVHTLRILTKRRCLALHLGQHAFLHQRIQADEIGVAGECGIGLVGRVKSAGMAGCTQGQNLPIGLTGLFQPIHKVIGRLIKTADTILGGQAGDRQQYTGSSHIVLLLCIFVIINVSFVGS